MKYRIHFKPYNRKFIHPVRLGTVFSTQREGAIVRVQNQAGKFGYGEIAPLLHFGTESLSQALHFCQNLDGEIEESRINEIPESLPCVRFALESARNMAAQGANRIEVKTSLRAAALLPSGNQAIDQVIRLAEEGFTIFKWKIGVDAFDSEKQTFHRLLTALPSGGRLRLDANGILDQWQAKRWLELLQGCDKIEFLEQPLPVECLQQMRGLAETHSTSIALDESTAGLNNLKDLVANDWKGPLVVKTSLVSSPEAFLKWSANCPCPLVFSSTFETAIGFQAGLKLAAEAGNSNFALGFGTNRFLAEDGLSLHGNGPELNPDLLSMEDFLQIWNRLDAPAKTTIHVEYDGKDLLLCEKDPVKFQQFFFEAFQDGKNRIFLADPEWGISRWKELFMLVQPDKICGSLPEGLSIPENSNSSSFEDALKAEGAVLIPTGGSTGGLRFAIHTVDTLTAAVDSFVAGFGIAPVNSYCLLPLHHVSGLMQLVRARQTGGKVVFGSCKELLAGRFPEFAPGDYIISLVSLQLRRLLGCQETAVWLRRFKMVLLGGGNVDHDLLELARNKGIRLAPSYGMTETAAVCAALTPDEFLSAQEGSGRALPGVEISIHDENGNSLGPGKKGRIHIQTKALFGGYFLKGFHGLESQLLTEDEGFLDSVGSLHVTGRLDRIIITGGEKVDPAEVEQAIVKTGLVADVYVYGVNDQEWGQKVVTLYVPLTGETSSDSIKASLSNDLTPSQIPKSWKCLSEIPRNDLGKIDFHQVEAQSI